jgi:ParB family transcriptional regulator, chromosome partitioning protein
MMSKPSTAVLDIDSIEVEDGFNPRTEFDDAEMNELVASIEESGITTALTVRPDGGTRHVLVAGERRLIAARRAGLKEVPVLIREKDGALAAAIAENLIRSDLNPVEEARALQRLSELEKIPTHKKLAVRVGKSARFVSERLRLLDLPEGCHAAIASGAVPVEAERNLRNVAKVSLRVAECVCELVQAGEVGGREVVTAFDDVLVAASRAKVKAPPTMIDPGSVRLREVITDEQKLGALPEDYRNARPWVQGEDIVITLGEVEIDAARAAQQLIEFEVDHGEWSSVVRFITDRELAADLAERAIERVVREAKEREERQAKLAAKSGVKQLTEEEQKAARAEKRQEVKQAKTDAEQFNEALGRKLMDRRGAAARREQGLNRAKALAFILLSDHDGLAGRGLRLVLPQLREVEHKALKSGAKRQKITYADRVSANEYLWKKVEEARTESQVIEIVAEALVAATLADEAAVAPSDKVHWYSPGCSQAEKLLAADIKAARPRRRRASR